MTTDYNPIAEQYQRSKQQPWRTYVEAHTLMQLVGDPAGKAVIDIACGEGYYSRMMRHRGAARVVGVDMSDGMIALAQQAEAQQRLGVEYVVGDARTLAVEGEFDLAVAAWLLNYTHDLAELDAMCQAVARCLKPGGRFVTVNSSPVCDFAAAPSYRAYGFETAVVGTFGPGAPVTWTFHLDDGPFDIENYFLDLPAHEAALRDAGFAEVRWHQPRVSAEGEAALGRDYWRTLLESPPFIFIECVKG
jgi:ubiquinone/menaquinone biosynthesis C-methylase UbiE